MIYLIPQKDLEYTSFYESRELRDRVQRLYRLAPSLCNDIIMADRCSGEINHNKLQLDLLEEKPPYIPAWWNTKVFH